MAPSESRPRSIPLSLQDDSLSSKAKYLLLGVAVTLSAQICWSLFAKKRRKSVSGRPSSTGGTGNGTGTSSSRTISPLHHLDLQKLKSRSSASSNNARSEQQQGDAPIFQIVLTGGPCGGKSR